MNEKQYDFEVTGVVTDLKKMEMVPKTLKVSVNRDGIARSLTISDGNIKFTIYNGCKFAKYL